MNLRYCLIAVEGIDGSGKTTVAQHIDEFLRRKNLNTSLIESGGMPGKSIVSQIKRITHNFENKDMTWTTETFLYLARLAQRVDEYIRPLLDNKSIVIVDRFTMSVLVLAHYARGQPRDLMIQMLNFAIRKINADLTILCDLEPSVALTRITSSGEPPSRKESEGVHVLNVLRLGYLQEVEQLGELCVILRTDQMSLQDMLSEAESKVCNFLRKRWNNSV